LGSPPRLALIVLCSFLVGPDARSQETTPPPTPAQLAAMERVRPAIDAIWLEVRTPSKDPEERPRFFWEITDRLIAIGPDALPFLTSEIDLLDPATFHFCAYSLGRLGGPEAEAALRKSVRAAEARGGKFGSACKRYALFGLALLGAADVFDLLQNGKPMLGAEMVPELPLATQLALLVGPPALPSLEKQLATYRSDPEAVPKLDVTLLALGRVGDASLLPKIEPLLAHTSPEVRALAADAISRLGEPPLCAKLLVPLASPEQSERRFVASSLERWEPEPCYKAMVGRLEVEQDIGVRRPIYNAIVVMGGESALDVFRLYLRTSDWFQQGVVILAIGQIGSKKGLNMLRALLTDENESVVVRALESIGAIGGEGAIDTLMAATADGRRNVAYAARDILTNMGVAKVAPRVASVLLEIVHEPVGDPSLRQSIAVWGEALVKFAYTDPTDDLAAAAALQVDPEIKESLDSCVRRLRALTANGDDVAAWSNAASSPFLDVRRLAYRRLAEIGSPASVRAIGTRLKRADLPSDERAAALLAIADARTAGAADLVELHLSDPAYDVWTMSAVRSAAAYAARRLGGERMVRALRDSAVRRDGRDWATLVYLAVLEKGRALPTLQTLRVRRLRYPESRFGHEERQIDGIISGLVAGHEPKLFDVPPDALFAL